MIGGWFSRPPHCPLGKNDKDWIEYHFTWLATQFGLQPMLDSSMIIPGVDNFPASFCCTPDGVQDLLDHLCDAIGRDPSAYQLTYFESTAPQWELDSPPAPLTPDGRLELWLEIELLSDPPRLIANLTRELGHALLVEFDPTLELADDHDELSELVAVYHGMGYFLANTALHVRTWTEGQTSGWEFQRTSYMSLNMFGYAMALYTLGRGQPQPEWASHLRPDVRGALRNGVQYIVSTGDCLFEPARNP